MRRVVIDPITRVEGHGKITLLLDEHDQVRQARLHIVEFRGFEKFIQGRPYWELPVLVQRLCGICPVSHHLAAAKALDQLHGVQRLPPAAERLRRLLHFGQVLQSHALHFFHLSSPDLLFGGETPAARRHILAVLERHPDIALQGIKLRQYGQQVIEAITGKRIHGVAAVPGGMNQPLERSARAALRREISTVIRHSEAALTLAKRLFLRRAEEHRAFGLIHSPFLSLSGPNGELELYHGGLRVRQPDGALWLDQVDYRHYGQHIREAVKPWSYMKFPFFRHWGEAQGWYRVGPLARLNTCDRIDTPKAERARQAFMACWADRTVQSPLAYHWARMIELLHCAERIRQLLQDDSLLDAAAVAPAASALQQAEGIGVIEAPRGTLFHHYRVDEQGLVTRANLIVSTTSNNQAMNETLRQVARQYLNGHTLTETLLNQLEVAIRAYDPCLSCATHALGRMPLQLELVAPQGQVLARLGKSADGRWRDE